MSDSSVNQGRILRNLMRLMDVTCGRSLYEVLPRGVQVWLPEQGKGVYPDLLVVAGEPLLHDGQDDKLLNPCVIFEILSGPTPSYNPEASTLPDSSGMFRRCRAIPYLQTYLFVHQTEARVEQFYRAEENLWGMTTQSGLDSVVELAITDARLPMMDIYERVDFSLLV
ncbi:Uma2 family endonuclease [Nodosilinea sp. FACHB-131]|uniref:Uma2 family endonuclease n=1 Tax=Cyanophyceae TaxID=3028117 RepID=UPI001689725C|nr:Uma2 family endonuclease [Nodosilinea sp. FACHB-131]MBD1872124.1 Uma2 family endonuclease [Nodosilinea sp. FACHB-131]